MKCKASDGDTIENIMEEHTETIIYNRYFYGLLKITTSKIRKNEMKIYTLLLSTNYMLSLHMKTVLLFYETILYLFFLIRPIY